MWEWEVGKRGNGDPARVMSHEYSVQDLTSAMVLIDGNTR